MDRPAEVIVLGAGIVGLATAYHLAVKHHIKNVVLVDEREPLGLTSRRGTMAYRNWFPGPGDEMVQLMNRSIQLLEAIDDETAHALRLSRGGYIYLTANPAQLELWRTAARDAEPRGVGPFRDHSRRAVGGAATTYVPNPRGTWRGVPDGVDLLTDPETIRELLPCVTPDVVGMLHIRRCGAFDVFALADWLLERAQRAGVRLVRERVTGFVTPGDRIERVQLASGTTLSTRKLVIAAGPLLPEIDEMLHLDIPVYNELHAKVTLRDSERVLPRYGDLVYWSDPLSLEWSAAERAQILASRETRWLASEFPAGVHYLPKGTDDDPRVMALWTYDTRPSPYVEPPVVEPLYSHVVLRGLARMIPQARVYFGREDEFEVDAGYYCKTQENRPLIGPLPIQGVYLCGALSGFGVMASQAAAELVSAHVTGAPLPDYANAFLLTRYQDPQYRQLLNQWDARSGQL